MGIRRINGLFARVQQQLTVNGPPLHSVEAFGAFVRSLRTQQQLRIDDAAALCGVSVQLLSDLENGNRSVGLDKALAVARQLGLTLLAVPKSEQPQAIAAEYVRFIPITDLDAAIIKVQRHQLDMLLDLRTTPRYWVNEHSANGYLAEKVLQQAYAVPGERLKREIVSGRDIRYADWVMPGVLAMNMMFSCLWGVGWVVVRYRKNGVLRRLQATPLTPFEFLSAQVIARLLIITVVTLTVFIGANAFVDFTMRGSYFALFLVFFAGGACLTSMGLMVATRLKTEEVADGLLNLASWPMMILSGVWFSMEGTNPITQTLSQIFPLTHLVNAARRIMIDGAGLSGAAFELSLLSGLTVLLLLFAARLFRWS